MGEGEGEGYCVETTQIGFGSGNPGGGGRKRSERGSVASGRGDRRGEILGIKLRG